MLGVIPSIYQREPRDAVSSPSERERARPYVAILLVPLLAGLALAVLRSLLREISGLRPRWATAARMSDSASSAMM